MLAQQIEIKNDAKGYLVPQGMGPIFEAAVIHRTDDTAMIHVKAGYDRFSGRLMLNCSLDSKIVTLPVRLFKTIEQAVRTASSLKAEMRTSLQVVKKLVGFDETTDIGRVKILPPSRGDQRYTVVHEEQAYGIENRWYISRNGWVWPQAFTTPGCGDDCLGPVDPTRTLEAVLVAVKRATERREQNSPSRFAPA